MNIPTWPLYQTDDYRHSLQPVQYTEIYFENIEQNKQNIKAEGINNSIERRLGSSNGNSSTPICYKWEKKREEKE